MPINESHAYARGAIFKKEKYSLFGTLIKGLIDWHQKEKAQMAWKEFGQKSVMGEGCFLGPNAWCINFGESQNIRIGNKVYCRGLLRCGARGKGRILIGDEVYIGDDTIISAENCVEIGNLTMISHGVSIFDSTGHPVDPYLREKDWRVVLREIPGPRPELSSAPVRIGSRVWIGFNSIIMRGVTIGDNAVVGAGSVVLHDVEANIVVAGNPARLVNNISQDKAQG